MLGNQPDRLGQDPDRLLLGLVLASAIGRLDQHVVRVGYDGRIAQDRRAGPAEIAGEHDTQLGAALAVGDAQADDRRAQDVAGVHERRVNPGRHLHLVVIADPTEAVERGARLALAVERLVEVDIELRRLGPEGGLRIRGDGERRRAPGLPPPRPGAPRTMQRSTPARPGRSPRRPPAGS